jgi:hypothetical protein
MARAASDFRHFVGRLPILAALSAMAAVAIMGCGGDKTAAPAISPQEALSKSRAAMAAVAGFKFELTHPSGATSLPGGLFLTRADGAVAAPDRVAVNAEANFGRVFVKVQAVVIGGETYMTNFLTGAWAAVPPQDSPFSFLDPPKLVASLLGEVKEPSFVEQPKTGGDMVVAGKVSAAPFAALVGAVDASKTVAVKLKLDPGTFVLKEALVEGALQTGDGAGAARLIKFSGFGEQIKVERPM